MLIKEFLRRYNLNPESIVLCLFAAFSFFSIAGTQIALGLAFLIYLARHFRAKSISGQKCGLELLLAGLFIWALLSSAFSVRPAESFIHLKHLLLIATIYLLADQTRSKQSIRIFVGVWLASAAIISLVGLLRYLAQDTLKVMATQSTTMTWAAMLVPATTVSFVLLFALPASSKIKSLLAIAAVLQLIALFYSFVRGAYLGFFAGVGFVLLLRKPKLIFALIAAAALAIWLAPESLQTRFLSIFDLNSATTQVRLIQWRHAFEMIQSHPIFGFGWVDLGALHRDMIPADPAMPTIIARDVFYIGHFHSNIIMWMMIWGLPGLVLMLVFFARITQLEWQAFRSHPDPSFEAALALGCLGSLAGYFVTGLFDWTFGDAETVTILWMTVGLALRKSANGTH